MKLKDTTPFCCTFLENCSLFPSPSLIIALQSRNDTAIAKFTEYERDNSKQKVGVI